MVKNPPANAGDTGDIGFDSWVGKDPLDKIMATHSGIHAWKIPWTEELGRRQSMGLRSVGHNLATKQPHHQQQCYNTKSFS